MNRHEEGNKLFAEFMEVAKCSRCKDCGAYQYGPGAIYLPRDMEYHKSWDWLMPVAKKCIDSWGDRRHDIFEALHAVNFKKLYVACASFVTWANNNERKVKHYRLTGKMT